MTSGLFVTFEKLISNLLTPNLFVRWAGYTTEQPANRTSKFGIRGEVTKPVQMSSVLVLAWKHVILRQGYTGLHWPLHPRACRHRRLLQAPPLVSVVTVGHMQRSAAVQWRRRPASCRHQRRPSTRGRTGHSRRSLTQAAACCRWSRTARHPTRPRPPAPIIQSVSI